mmetsp:Transcript_19709/g.34985  ORF Transcript_19709/g.34985 Transcript_19709/m.34985 type:complete len:451 (-) Transcript_19709:131-1483(-)
MATMMRPAAGYLPQANPAMQPYGSFQQPFMGVPQGTMPSPVVRAASVAAPSPMRPQMPQMGLAQPMPTQMRPQTASYVHGQPPVSTPAVAPMMMPQAVQAAPVPPGAVSSAAPPPASLVSGPEDLVFMVGDKVQLKGQAGNPAYEGKLYEVEAVDYGSPGAILVAHKLQTATSRMTFNKAFLELVEAVDAQPDAQGPPEDGNAAVQASQKAQEAFCDFIPGDIVRIAGLDSCPRHNGRICTIDTVDDLRKVCKIVPQDAGGNNILELAPSYLELVQPADHTKVKPILPAGAISKDGDVQQGDMVRILAPPQHKGKVARVEAGVTGTGSLRVRLQEPADSVTMLVVSPTHVENLDGSPVAGTAEAAAATAAQADALRQAAMPPPPGTAASAPLAVQTGDRVRILPSMAAHSGKVGIIEAANDGAGSAVVKLEDQMGGVNRLRINPVHLELA